MGVCEVYDNRTVTSAWQYDGNIESAPVWVNQPPYTSLECDDNDNEYLFVANVGNIPLNKGDWIVKSSTSNAIYVYSDAAFSIRFTKVPEKEKKPAVKKYREIIKVVDAWQYTGELRLPDIPGWVLNMILHNRLGYQMATGKEIFQMYNNLCWTTVEVGDWIVHYDDGTLLLLPDATFKASFEEIE